MAIHPGCIPDPVNVLLLAGSRPGHDPLAHAAGVSTKALVPVAGRPMLDRVVRTLTDDPRIGTVTLLSQQGAEGLTSHPQTAWIADRTDVRFVTSGGGISQSILDAIESNAVALPVLVTTVDNVLMNGAILAAFLRGIDPASDVAVAMVERRTVLAAYPHSRRTWLSFAGGAYSGANLFWLGSARAREALTLWRSVEQDRKKGWKILSLFGPMLLIGAALRLIGIHSAIMRAGARLGLRAQVVELPIAEACIDADKPDDVALIEKILTARG